MITPRHMTAEQLLQLPRGRCRHELIGGVLRIMPLHNWRHGAIAATINALVGQYVLERRLGMALGPGSGFVLARKPDTVRAADFAFITRANFPAPMPPDGYWPGAPDLAVDVVSLKECAGEVREKAQAWVDAKVQLLWVVDLTRETVAVHQPSADVVVKTVDDVLDGGDVLTGFRCSVREIFTPIA